jgi:spermidine/putrescine-binding protein
MENFQKKINTHLHEKKGAELILGNDSQRDMVKLLIKQSAVMDLRDKVPNIKKIYDALLNQEVYYVPIGMDYNGPNFNKKVLQELGIKELGIEWEPKDYFELKEKWLKHSPRYFTVGEFNYITDRYLWQCKLYDAQNKKATINTPEVKSAIKSIRDEIYGSYELNNNYKYENYYNMLYEPASEEALSEEALLFTKEYKQQDLYARGNSNTSSRLYARQIQDALDSGLVFSPNYKDIDTDLYSYGFLVNKNGNNLELAYEFINGLLADETQMEMWQPDVVYQYYPVNKEIEEEIIKAELQENADQKAIAIKEAALNRIKQGHAHLLVLKNMGNATMLEDYQLYERLKKQMIKFIFADMQYSDEELSRELKNLEAEYTIWLNE